VRIRGGSATGLLRRALRRPSAPGEELVELVPHDVGRSVFARVGTSDLAAFEEVFGDAFAVEVPWEPDVIFDLGANVGYASVLLAHRHPDVRIVAVEPEPSNLALLRRNVEGLPVDVVAGAVWPRPGTLALHDPGKGRWGFRVREGGEDVVAVTVPELMERAETDFVDLVKLDVEGAELELFSADTDWLDRVGALTIELHDRYAPGCRAAVEAAVERASVEFDVSVREARLVAVRADRF
jgi:FkbM family methyltransferase